MNIDIIMQEDEMIMSANALASKWEDADELLEDNICNDMEALLLVMENKTSYYEFTQATQISNSQYRLH